jgi:hypothetical protein
MSARRSKLPPLVVGGMDVNESAHRMIERALVEVRQIQGCSKRLRALIKSLAICQQAGAQLPADLVGQLAVALENLHSDLAQVHEGEA